MSRTGKTSPFSFSPSPFFCDTAEIQLCSSNGDGGHDGHKTKIKTPHVHVTEPVWCSATRRCDSDS